jgi:hypothetical protein
MPSENNITHVPPYIPMPRWYRDRDDELRRIQTDLLRRDLYNHYRNNPMGKDLKTTIAGVLAGVAMILRALHVADIPDFVLDAVTAVAVFMLGLFAKDKKPNG